MGELQPAQHVDLMLCGCLEARAEVALFDDWHENALCVRCRHFIMCCIFNNCRFGGYDDMTEETDD